MTSRLNQDVLESYFSEIRGLGLFYDHPNPVAVIQRIKSSILGKNTSIVLNNSNIQTVNDDTSENIPLTAHVINKAFPTAYDDNLLPNNSGFPETDVMDFLSSLKQSNLEGEKSDSSKEEPLTSDQSTIRPTCGTELNENEELLEILAGYICYRLYKKFPKYKEHMRYGKCADDIQKSDWLSVLSRGKLMRPSEEWREQIRKLETDFQLFHGTTLNRSKNVIKNFCDLIIKKYPHFEEFALRCYARTRSFIRMKALNKKAQNKKRSYETSRKQTKKFKKVVT